MKLELTFIQRHFQNKFIRGTSSSVVPLIYLHSLSNRNCKLKISTAQKKAKSWEPAYSQALVQDKIDSQRVKIQRVRQADSPKAKVDCVWR